MTVESAKQCFVLATGNQETETTDRPSERASVVVPEHHHRDRRGRYRGEWCNGFRCKVGHQAGGARSRQGEEHRLGLDLKDALHKLSERVDSAELHLFVTAVIMHRQTGGNLAEILDSIAFTIRERVRIKGEIRTLTAQQRLSGYVVGFLPIGLAGFLFIAAPGFMTPMFDDRISIIGLPGGVIILAIGGFAMFIGFMLIRKIVDIEV